MESAAHSSTVTMFVTLRWRLLRGAIRHGGTEQVGAVLSLVAAAIVGIGIGVGVAFAGRASDDPTDLAVAFCTIVLFAMLGLGIVAGVSQPIDPRVIACEPLSERQRLGGLLAASAFGPPGLAGIAVGVGLGVGTIRGAGSVAIVVLAVSSWLVALLLVARTVTNLLAVLISRFPRSGQLLVGVSALGFYGVLQFLPFLARDLDESQQDRLLELAGMTPPGLIGRALGSAGDSPAEATIALFAGSLWLPLLGIAFAWSTRRLTHATPRLGPRRQQRSDSGVVRDLLRGLCGNDPAGAIAWRSLLTRFRTPRTALETVTGAGLGLAAVLGPSILRDEPGSGAVLVGGAIQLAVLFMAGNSFGVDGPGVTHELLAGADARVLVTGKVRSIAIVASPLAIIGPLAAAAITGEWRYLVAGFGIGIGSLLAGTGAAVVQSAYVPIAIPESDNPFAGGESGQGMVAAILLIGVLLGLAIATIPVALGLFWATDRGHIELTTALGIASIGAGWGVMLLGRHLATRRLIGRGPEFIASITPAR